MENPYVSLPITIFISFVFSCLIFYSLYIFKNKKPYQRIYNHLFISFLLSGIFMIFNNKLYSEDFILSFSFTIFLFFLTFTYRSYGENHDLLYFTLISFYSINLLFYYMLVKYSSILLAFSETNILNYIIILLLVVLFIIHKKNKVENKLIIASYILLLTYFSLEIFIYNPINLWINLALLTSFFILQLIISYKQTYSPLIQKLEQLKKQTNKQNAELPEHIRQKFQIMEHNKAKLMSMAFTDKMTGVYNKEKIISVIYDMIKDPRVTVFSILIFDIDNFKKINDNLGHLVGDECLINLTKIGLSSIRQNDFLGRYGGDEFIMVLSTLDPFEAKIIAERFRTKVAATKEPHFTISIGVGSYPDDGTSFKSLVESADKALYLSKERGKNKVSHIKHY